MSEIDVSKCAFGGLNMCKSPINKYDIECDKVPIENCYYKQLQQLKQENEELKRIIEKQNNYDATKQEQINNLKEQIKNLNYVLYEERDLCMDVGIANLKIATLKRDRVSIRNRFKYEYGKLKQQLKEIQEIAKRERETHRYNGAGAWVKILQITEGR